MSWQLNDKEFTSVLSLPTSKRYTYFTKRVADWGELWSLYGADGWVLASDEAGRPTVPVWPHQRFAQECAVDNWDNTQPKSIDIHLWQTRWTPGMSQDNRMVAVFPLPTNKGIIVSPEKLKIDIDEALAELE